MKKLTFLLISFFVYSTAFSMLYLPSKAKVELVKTKKLLVALKTDDKIYNEKIQQYVNEYWKFENTGIEFKDENDIKELSEEELKDYCILSSGWDHKSNQLQGEFLLYNFNLVARNDKPVDIFNVWFLADTIIDDIDYIFTIQQFNNHLTAADNGAISFKETYDYEKSMDIINSKTLLIEKEMLGIDETKVPKVYRTSFKITESSIVNNLAINQKDQHMYIKLVWSGTKHLLVYVVIDALNGQVLSVVGTGGIKVELGKRTAPKYYVNNRGSGFPHYHNSFSSAATTGGVVHKNPNSKIVTLCTLFRTTYSIKDVHLKYIKSKLAQKTNM